MDGSTTTKTVTLITGQPTLVTVTAADAAGNISLALSATVTTAVAGGPTWPDGTLLLAAASERFIEINWTEANDDTAVARYRVLLDGAEIATVVEREYTFVNLQPATTYEVGKSPRERLSGGAGYRGVLRRLFSGFLFGG
ncbi:MAG: hypothetical protein GY822_05995 [Deltaproteobacteria bacterium]|nr:hypothetical protein [Deltaproteobacteria bacterium]